MLTAERVRELALALPGAVEQEHHGRPSFRVRGRIFATLWSATELNVMAGDELIRTVVVAEPDRCAPVHWGARLSAVRIDLTRADDDLVGFLLEAARERLGE
jgi:hypothetical protein